MFIFVTSVYCWRPKILQLDTQFQNIFLKDGLYYLTSFNTTKHPRHIMFLNLNLNIIMPIETFLFVHPQETHCFWGEVIS